MKRSIHISISVRQIIGLLCCAFGLSACGLSQKGMVMMTDPTYRATVIGTQQDGFSVPDGILWRQGKFVMADEGGGALRIWSNANEVKTLCDASLGIQSPEDLVMDSEGNVFFTDDDAGGVWEVEHSGKAFLLAGKDKGLVSTEGIALAPTGEILVGDGLRHQVYSVSRSGEVSVFLGSGYGITKPESMVFDEKGNLYIADNEDQIVYLLTPEMKLQRLIENQPGFSPETIWYAHGTLFITDSAAGKLYRYTPEEGLKTIAVFGGKLAAVNGLTMDEEGNLYVSIQTDLRRQLGYIVKLEHEPQP
jgi:sugar lactone lactonase YvrE